MTGISIKCTLARLNSITGNSRVARQMTNFRVGISQKGNKSNKRKEKKKKDNRDNIVADG